MLLLALFDATKQTSKYFVSHCDDNGCEKSSSNTIVLEIREALVVKYRIDRSLVNALSVYKSTDRTSWSVAESH